VEGGLRVGSGILGENGLASGLSSLKGLIKI
jgi:hypothetical protein